MCAVGNGYDVPCLVNLGYDTDLEWPWVLVIPLLAIAAMFVGFLTERVRKRKATGRFRGRETLSFDEFYDQFYRECGLEPEAVREVLEFLAENLGTKAGKLRPSDEFPRELAPGRGLDYDDDVLIFAWQLEEMFKKRGMPIEETPIKTVDDYIRLYCALLKVTETE